MKKLIFGQFYLPHYTPAACKSQGSDMHSGLVKIIYTLRNGLAKLHFSCIFFPNRILIVLNNLLDMRNPQEQVEKAFCYQKLFWPFTVWINCSRDLKNFAKAQPSASNFKSFSRSLEHFFLTVGQNNFGNKIPFLPNSKT